MFDLKKFFSKQPKSSNVAKDRLKLVLVHDRANCSPELLEMMRGEILEVLAKYVNIDEQKLDIRISNHEKDFEGKPALIANIPITSMKRGQEK
ncbi:cell division topological specificity factor MinE [Acidaminobacter sp. JC074]|uniref:cell division topological specificity factor MinE n=1 Tax=Acidaminobacter sp. JC074 TaxID=2530199 RepID=UPI001F0F96DA|nr:cell division topological specificity factor MinE [Acidaminobacter sp. JC074]MCH4886658.1 cell division topological specificity factor MinE [Acidaminobacter sp. JC074]